jgi:hypothetical protein
MRLGCLMPRRVKVDCLAIKSRSLNIRGVPVEAVKVSTLIRAYLQLKDDLHRL